MLNDLSLKKLTDIHNTLAETYEEFEPIKRLSTKPTAIKKIAKMLGLAPRDGVIRILKTDYKKRGKAAERWAVLEDGMTVEQYVAKCAELKGHTVGEARRDLRYNQKLGLVGIFRV